MDASDIVTIRAQYRSYHVDKCHLSDKMKSFITKTNMIHSPIIYYAMSNIIELLTLKEEDITDELLMGGADEDTIEAFSQAHDWELPVVCKILKQRILNDPLTDQTLKIFHEINDPEYPKLLEKYLLQSEDQDNIKGLIQAHEWKLPIVYQIMKQRLLNQPLTRQTLKALREANDHDYPELLKKYLLMTVEEDNIYGDIIKEYQSLHDAKVI